VAEREAVRDRLEAEKQALAKKAGEVESPVYIERVAREKLNLQKEGEIVVVLPKDLSTAVAEEAQPQLPNWQKWWKLFF
jgi:cell division protein FtsB